MSIGANKLRRSTHRSEGPRKVEKSNGDLGSRDQRSSYAVQVADGGPKLYGEGTPKFVVHVASDREWTSLLNADEYTAALAFVEGRLEITGDIIAATRFYSAQHKPTLRHSLATTAALYAPDRLQEWIQSKKQASQNIRFHYDRSNDFYRQFLDPRMVYSCAYFEGGVSSLEDAQIAKIEHICRKLFLESGDRLLDVGCGWGALVIHAAGIHGAIATGCTLSVEQLNFAQKRVIQHGLGGRISLFERDYRDMQGPFDKIASVGMVEHVGRRRLREYFKKLYELLDDDGLVLNHGITRPEPLREGPESLFIRRNVFPGGEIPRLSEMICAAENAGFEVLDLENLRRHYARTCKAWVENLRNNEHQCLKYLDSEAFRTWIIFLAGSAIRFEDGLLGLHQLLLCKRGRRRQQPMTRSYMYADRHAPGERSARRSFDARS
jgi:cyclopropane-fatty-acyl-phospholipid synthase